MLKAHEKKQFVKDTAREAFFASREKLRFSDWRCFGGGRQNSPWSRRLCSEAVVDVHGRPHIGANGVSWPPLEKMDEKLKSENVQKKSSFLRLCYSFRAIRAGRCRERRYVDHIFIQIYFRMHYFVVNFQNFLRFRRQGGIDPANRNPADVPVDVVTCSINQSISLFASKYTYLNIIYVNGRSPEKHRVQLAGDL